MISVFILPSNVMLFYMLFFSNWSDLLSHGIDAQCSSQFLSTRCVCSLCHTLPSSTSKCIQCISYLPLSSICPRCGFGYACRLLSTLSHLAHLINVARVITTITHHSVSILWHHHHAASPSNVWRSVFGGINHCQSIACGQRVTV